MKTPKLLGILASALVLTQCTTTNGVKAFDPAKASLVVKVTVPPAVKYETAKQPGSVKYIKDVATAIDSFAASKTFDDVKFKAALYDAAGDATANPEVQIVVDTVVALYSSFYADVVEQKLDQSTLTPVLQALSAAIRQGLPQ